MAENPSLLDATQKKARVWDLSRSIELARHEIERLNREIIAEEEATGETGVDFPPQAT